MSKDDAAGQSRPKASIVIRCYNEGERIGRLFRGLRVQSFQDFEVIVVDSGSTDNTLDIVAEEDASVLHINKEEFSFGRSLNLGCAEARGEYLVIVSAHCYPVNEDWLRNLLAAFDDDKVAAVYGKQRGIDMSHFSEQQIFRQWFAEKSVGRQDGPFSNNANCAVRRELWERFPYDEELPGLEDVAWASTVMRHGWWLSYRADAGVIHIHDETRNQVRNRYRREAIAFQELFVDEHFNLWDLLRLSSRCILSDWHNARDEKTLWHHWRDIVGFRIAQYVGTYQGFHTRRPVSSQLKRRFYYP